jgi:hypothetical protein
VTSCIDPSVRIVAKSPKVGPLLYLYSPMFLIQVLATGKSLFYFHYLQITVVSPWSALLLEVERRVGELMGKTSALTLPGAFILDLFGPLRSGNHLHNIGKSQTNIHS